MPLLGPVECLFRSAERRGLSGRETWRDDYQMAWSDSGRSYLESARRGRTIDNTDIQ